MLISCVIIEDEPLASERATEYIKKLPYLKLLNKFENVIDASAYLGSVTVDLIFLDIHLGEVSGIQFLESVKTSAEIILTTAYHDYALKAFDLRVADYLLKPYTFERFLQAVSRVQEALGKRKSLPDQRFIFIKTEYRLEKVFLDDILYIEGMRDYRKIVTKGKPIMTLQTFLELEQELSPTAVCRVHKSYMVALDKINSIEKDGLKINGIDIPVSETYRKTLMALITRG